MGARIWVGRHWPTLAGLFVLALMSGAALAAPPVCLYVGSYHAGYHWNDGIEQGLAASLDGVCRLERFYMNTKRHTGADHARAQARAAMDRVAELAPDVIIACDDNASRFLVVPHLKDAEVPVVFCGVNWTVAEYGYPFTNVTGMVEVAPNQAVVEEAKALVPEAESFAFIAADVLTQRKEVARLADIAKATGLAFAPMLVDTMAAWEAAFRRAQDAGFVILGNPIGIPDWDPERARRLVDDETRTLTATFGAYMRPFVVFAMSNMPQEQGQWAGEAAAAILAGTAPTDIPIIANHRWSLHASPHLAAKAGLSLPEPFLRRAIPLD